MSKSVLLITPDFNSFGGIAYYTRLVARSCQTLGYNVIVIALHDAEPVVLDTTDIRIIGSSSKKVNFAVRFLKLLYSEKPTFVWAMHINFLPLVMLAAVTVPRSIRLLTVYGIDAWKKYNIVFQLAIKAFLFRVFSISRYTSNKFAGLNPWIPTGILTILPIGFSYFSDEHNRLTHSTTVVRMLTVSRISKADNYKGHKQVIKALKRLIVDFPQLEYHIVGDGDGLQDLENLTQSLGVSAYVKFLGSLSQQELVDSYYDADIFIMPSSGEGFGIVFLEAMAHGLPVIAGNVDATPEVVRHGETGILVEPSDIEALTDACRTLLSNPTLRAEMGLKACAHVRDNFTFDIFTKQLDHELEVLLERNP